MKRIAPRTQLVLLGLTLITLSLGAAPPIAAGTRIVDVTVDQARALVQQRGGQKDFVILDVRTPEEFAEGHLAGAVNVNFLAPDFATRLSPLDRGKTYLVYCRTGNRSSRAVQAMERTGIQSVYHMVQGIVAWQAKGFPLSRT